MLTVLTLLFVLGGGVTVSDFSPNSMHLALYNDKGKESVIEVLLISFLLFLCVWYVLPKEDNSIRYVISWVTLSNCASTVRFGIQSGVYENVTSPYPTVSYDKDGGFNHHVNFPKLPSDTTIYYLIGSDEGWSKEFQFKTAKAEIEEFTAWVAADFGEKRKRLRRRKITKNKQKV